MHSTDSHQPLSPASADQLDDPGRVDAGASTRVLTDLAHGGHAVPDTAPGAAELADAQRGASLLSDVVRGPAAPRTTSFDYLFSELADTFPDHHLPVLDPAAVVAKLTALGTAMAEATPPQEGNTSTVPTVYTYWGQFIDHDLTANTDSNLGASDVTRPDLAPIQPAVVVETLRNLRDPALNLDSVYADGPAGTPALYDGIRMQVGTVAGVQHDGTTVPGARIPPIADTARDIPRRTDGSAIVGDARNDENLILAQLHVAFLRFHNAAVDWVLADEGPNHSQRHVFTRARQLVRWHYQWLSVHDYLATVTKPGIMEQVLLGERPLLKRRAGRTYMPLEFSTAAFRMGHSMVRAGYDFNRNFTDGGIVLDGLAPLPLLFAFTGRATPPFRGQTSTLPFNWVIEWDRFVDKGSAELDHFARKIDTNVAPPLLELANEGTAPGLSPQVVALLKSLPVRNLLRGYLLAMPTGQAVATTLGITPLTPAELTAGASPAVVAALTDGGFMDATPLWFYVLKESEVRENGNHLGAVGSRIVCETIIGQLRHDPTSFLRTGWTPADGLTLPGGDLVVTISDFLRVARVL